MTTTHRRSARRRLVLATIVPLLVIASAAGCGQEKPVHTQADLDARPAISAVLTRYDEMQTRLRAAVDAAMGPQRWSRSATSGSEGGCGRDFAVGVVGTSVTMPSWTFPAPITDAQWPAVKKAVLDVVAGYGFQPGGMALDSGKRHELNAFDADLGAYVNLGNDVATVLTVTTGCHPQR